MLVQEATHPLSEGMIQAAKPDDPRVAQVLAVLTQVWPAGFDEVHQTIAGWYPVLAGFAGRGHYSGGAPTDGWVYSSIDDILGGAEGLLHELGHLKLKRMGVFYESWTAVLANSPDELYVSPIRKDKLRPMGAVLHALYSYLYVTEFDRRGVALDVVDRETYEINRARVAEGTAEVERNARWLDPDFGSQVLRWGYDLSGGAR